jgi:hypothetical protein
MLPSSQWEMVGSFIRGLIQHMQYLFDGLLSKWKFNLQ